MRKLSYAASVLSLAVFTGTPTIAQVIGANFQGSTLFIDSNNIPPDTNGAVGLDHVVEMINGRYSVYNKSNGLRVQTSSLNNFWTSAGVTLQLNSFDPRTIYDHRSGRWFACAVDNARNPNSFLVAVSNSSDPTAGWTGFKIDSDAANTRWADFPTFGVDRNGVYMSANMFGISGASTDITVVSIPKSDLLQPVPTVANKTSFELAGGSTRGFSQYPASSLEDTGTGIMLSRFDTNNRSRTSINNAAGPGAATLSTTVTIASAATASPPLARQPDGTVNIETGDARFGSSVQQVGNSLWIAHCVSISSRCGVRWYEINATTNAVIQTGTITDGVHEFFYPSISANPSGDVVIGYSRSGSAAGEFISGYASVGTTAAGVTTFGAPFVLRAGVANYFQDFGSGRNRWGDYSATNRDPADPQIFWTTQEYVSALNVWSTGFTEVIVPKSGESRWVNAADGNFNDAPNWVGGAVPGNAAHVILSRSTTPGPNAYNVTMPPLVNTAVNRLSVRQGSVNIALNNQTTTLTNIDPTFPSLTLAEFGGRSVVSISGGTLSSANAVLGVGSTFTAATSFATLNLSNMTWNNSSSVSVGGSLGSSGGGGIITLNSAANVNIAGSLKLWSGGTVAYNGGSLNVGLLDVAGGNFTETTNGSRLLIAGNVLVSSGKVDLNDNDMQVTAGTYAAITSLIASARGNGSWLGSGITSTAARINPDASTTLGTLTGAEYISVVGAGATFDGSPVAPSDILVKYTWYGDTDFNGVIDFDDYVRTDGGFNNGLAGWHNGDFNYDNIIDFDDYVLIDLAFNLQSGTLIDALNWLEGEDRSGSAGPGVEMVAQHFQQFGTDYANPFYAAVPEPSTCILPALLAFGFRRRRVS